MKITKMFNITKLTLSKKEWENIGRKQGWMTRHAKWGKDIDVEQPGKWDGYTLTELREKRNVAKKRQKNRKEQGKKADPKDTELLRELNFAIRAKTGWGEVE